MPTKAALVFVFAFGASSASAFVVAPGPINKPTSTCLDAEIAPDAEMFSEEHGDAPSLPPISPTSKRLFLVRHGEVINPGGNRPVYYGALDVPLSPLGEAEAQAAASYLERFDLQHVRVRTIRTQQQASPACLVGKLCGEGSVGRPAVTVAHEFDAHEESLTTYVADGSVAGL